MLWIVQNNLYNEEAYDAFIAALEACGQPYQVVKVVPFAHILDPEIGPQTGKVMTWGATTLDWIAKDRGWTPGTYYNENFDQRIWHPIYGKDALNADAEFYEFGSIPAFTGSRFIRPVHDLKVFAGMVLDGEDLEKWKTEVWDISDGYSTLTPQTPVTVSRIKEIECEARFFVVDGHVVTGSLYRQWGSTKKERLAPEDFMWEFAQEMVDRWQPAKAFVIDVALVDEELTEGMTDGERDVEMKVIEVNTINSSGFYAADPLEIVKAIVELESLK